MTQLQGEVPKKILFPLGYKYGDFVIGGQGLAKQLGNIKHTRLWFFFLETDQADKIVKNEKWATLGLKMEIAYAMEKQEQIFQIPP